MKWCLNHPTLQLISLKDVIIGDDIFIRSHPMDRNKIQDKYYKYSSSHQLAFHTDVEYSIHNKCEGSKYVRSIKSNETTSRCF